MPELELCVCVCSRIVSLSSIHVTITVIIFRLQHKPHAHRSRSIWSCIFTFSPCQNEKKKTPDPCIIHFQCSHSVSILLTLISIFFFASFLSRPHYLSVIFCYIQIWFISLYYEKKKKKLSVWIRPGEKKW